MNTYIVCFDIGGTALKCAVCSYEGEIKHKKSFTMVEDLASLCNIMKEYKEEMINLYPLEGVAISSCGAVHVDTGIIGGSSAVPFIHGPSWKDLIQSQLGLPCEIENDANCAALSEVYYGGATAINDMCFVVVGTGVGGAIVKDRKIHHGKHLYGGEFGMMLAKDEQGHMVNASLVASTSSMVRKAEKLYGGQWDGIRVFEEAEKGNEECAQIISTFYNELACCVFNIQHMQDPEAIVFGGAISARADFCERVMSAYQTLCRQIDIVTLTPTLMCCTYLQDANIIGALANYQLQRNV